MVGKFNKPTEIYRHLKTLSVPGLRGLSLMKFEDKIDASETVCVKIHLKEDSMHSERGNTFTESAQRIVLRIILLF